MKKIAVLLGTLVVSAIALLSMHRSFAHATPSTEAVSVFARNETLSSQMTLDKTSVITPGVLTFHEADETIIYNWFTYVPENMSQTEISYILVAGLHGSVTGKYDEVTELSRVMAEERTAWADKYRYILLVPVVPRSGQFYPVAFDLASFRGATDPFYQRPDLKVNLMIDQFISDLRTEGYNVHGKVFIEGKSAGGMFAQRYTLLHPERVWAIVAGAGHCGGAITLPESFCNSTPMDYAVGVNDFSSLVGYEFDRSTYMQVPQFIYIGEYDTEHTTVTPDHIGGFWTSQDQVDFLNDHFGDTDPVRVENQCNYLRSLGYNITFKLYHGAGHGRAPLDDIFGFFRRVLYPNEVYLPIVTSIYSLPALPIEIDGEGEDWQPYTPVATDPQGDTTGGPHTDLKAVYAATGPNYLYVMAEVYDPPLLSDASIELGIALIDNSEDTWRLSIDIDSDGVVTARVDHYDDEWEELQISAACAWASVMELRLPLAQLGNPVEMPVTFVGLFYYVGGERIYPDFWVAGAAETLYPVEKAVRTSSP